MMKDSQLSLLILFLLLGLSFLAVDFRQFILWGMSGVWLGIYIYIKKKEAEKDGDSEQEKGTGN